MKRVSRYFRSLVEWLRSSPVGFIAFVLFVVGLWLGITAHRGFMILMAMGAFGPGVLRQLGLLNDLDEFQKEASAKARRMSAYSPVALPRTRYALPAITATSSLYLAPMSISS